MQRTSKLSPEQWAEAQRMRAEGISYAKIGKHLGIVPSAIARRATKEDWPLSARATQKPPRLPKVAADSSATAGIRSRLALRLYRVIEFKIRMMELRMIKELQAHESADAAGTAPPPTTTTDERESFAALIESINQVTEMAAEPAPAAAGRRGAATGPINPELTALSADIDPDGLAIASEKDQFRRELAEHLGKMFAKP